MPVDSIDRLADVSVYDEYADALAIFFINYSRLPRANLINGGERRVLIEVLNENPDCIRTIKIAVTRYMNKIIDYASSNNFEMNTRTNISRASMNYAAIRKAAEQQFILLEPDFKAGIIAMMLDTALTKYEEQGKSFLSRKAFKLLSSSDLRIIEPWEQASVCDKCPNFEQVIAIHPSRDPKCSKCGMDNLTVRIYALDKCFESRKRNNKDLPIFISKLINRNRKCLAVTSKKLSDFGQADVNGDVDVFIEKTNTGIECKSWIIEFKATDDQLRDYGNEIRTDLEKYIKVGITHLIVVTNLDEKDTLKLRSFLEKSIKGSYSSLEIIPKSIRCIKEIVLKQG
jgi:hypothetical protein